MAISSKLNLNLNTGYKTSTPAVMLGKVPAVLEAPIKVIEKLGTVIEPLSKIFKSIQEGIAHSGGSVGITLTNAIKKVSGGQPIAEVTSEELEPNARKFKELIFGTAPIKSIGTRIEQAEQTIKEEKGLTVPFINKTISTPEKATTPLAYLGILGTIVLDFTGWGGGKKQVIELLTKTKKVEEVANVLKKINVAEDLIEPYAKAIAKMDKTEDVAKALGKISEIQKTTKVASEIAPEVQKGISEALKAGKGISMAEEVPKVAKGFKWTERGFLQSVRNAKPDVPLKVGGQYVPRTTDRLAMKAATLVKENIETAEKMAKTGTNDAAVATAAELIKHYSDEALKATSQAIKNTLYEKASDIAHITAKNLTEQGKAVQAASIMGRLTPEGMLKFAAKEINKYNEAIDVGGTGLLGLKKKIPEITAEQSKFILENSKKIIAMPDGIDKAMAFKKLNDYISALVPTPFFKKLIGVWKAGLLTGLKTSGLNTMSNLFHGISEVIKDIPAMAVDSVASLFTGKRTMVFTLKGIFGGIKEGFNKGWRYLKTGFDERNVAVKLDYRKINFGNSKLAKAIQGYEETIFKIMGAEDQPFYYGAKARSLQSQAIAQAKNAKLKGSGAQKFIDDLLKNPTDEILANAASDAEIAVFQNRTMLAQAARGIQKTGVGEFIVPFGRTPSAVAMQMINYSPMGIVKTIAQNIGKGKFDQRLFSQGLGRGITGSAIMYLGTELYKKGMINLDYPTGEKEKKLWELEGRVPNTIKIGDSWRNVNVLGPGGMILVAGGHFQKGLDETGSFIQAFAQSMAGAGKSLTEQTFLQGIQGIVDALNDPTRFAQGYFSNTISSFIPTIIGDIAKATDIYERRTSELLQKAQAKIPGLRQKLQPKITVLGQEDIRGGNFIETMIDPTRPSQEMSSPVINELRRLWNAGQKVSPTQLGDAQGYKALTPEQNTTLWKRTGELLDVKLSELINLPQYKKLSDEDKGKLISSFIDKANLLSRVQMVMDLTEGLEGQELKDELSKLKVGGLMTKEVLTEFMKLR